VANELVARGRALSSGSRYKRSYSTIEGIDRIMPVDVYVPGCPPRSEALMFAFLKLQQLIKDRRGHWPDRAIGPDRPGWHLDPARYLWQMANVIDYIERPWGVSVLE